MKSLRLSAAGLLVFMLLFVTAPPVHSADFSGLPITTIVLKDDQDRPWPDPGLLMPLLVVKQGAAFSRSDIRRGIEFLYLKARFRDIRVEGFPEGNGVRLEYTLYPVTVVRKVVIEGNHSLSSDRLKEVLGRIEGREFREEKLGELRQNVLALYQSEGFFDAAIEIMPEKPEDPHQVVLRLVIAESEPAMIEEIRFTGNTVFAGRVLLRALKSERGERLRRDLLLDTDMESVRQKYADAGYPAARTGPVDMTFRNRMAFITVHVDEGPKVVVRFTGNKKFSARKLNEALFIWQERDISDAVVESSAEKIKDLYREEGHADAAVEVKKTAAQGLLNLDFSIQEGPRVTVRKVRIEGNTAFREKDLREGMGLRESGWLRSRPFREDLLIKDIENIRDRYVEAGYLDAAIKTNVTRSADGREASVAVTIKEGMKTVVKSISFEGNTVFSAVELRAQLLGIKPGAAFSERGIEDDKYRILSAYSNKGYLYARVEEEKKTGNGTVDIRFRITEDRPVSIGKIILRGNERTEDRVIMRELLVKEGDAYDYSAILKSQQHIYRLGFFGLARFEPLRPGEKEYVKDMLLTVEERPAGALEFGVGYGNLDRFRGFAELSYSNLWGTAKSASLRFEGSNIAQEAVFSFREPWFLGKRLEGRFRLAWSDTKRLNPDTRDIYYETRKTELSTGLEKVTDRLKLSLIYQLEDVENYNVQQGATLSREDEGRVLVSSVTPGFIWDLRDDPFNPRKGSLHGVAVKQAMKALGSEADFTKATFQTSWYLAVRRSTVFALSARAGRAWPRGGQTPEVPLHERFYLGGGSTIRGYLQDSVGPQKTNPDGSLTPTGGDRMVLFNAEFRIGRAEGFGVVLFTDSGNVWVNQAVSLDDLRASYGIGIRYQTPVGPLRIDYGQKIHRRPAHFELEDGTFRFRPSESPGEIHFNIGHAF